jgi:hypothetical protein
MPTVAVPIPLPTDRHTAALMFQLVLDRALAQGAALRPPPPEPTSCCGRGCNGCVWEGYLAAASFWHEDAMQALNADSPGTNARAG